MVTTILGAGITGLSVSYHLGHKDCVIFERSSMHGGHAGSESRFGFTMDHGPHVSFTRNSYVESLFEKNTNGSFEELEVTVRNFHKDRWIHHPAQYHLWQVEENVRDLCRQEMLNIINNPQQQSSTNYLQWLRAAFGETFSRNFPELYTRKYWTTEAENLSTDWVGVRMQKLNEAQFFRGFEENTIQSAHYITKARYPRTGGFQSFFDDLAKGATIKPSHSVAAIDLEAKTLRFTDGSRYVYERLVSTLPLPEFVSICHQATPEVCEAATSLDCSQLLLIDVFVPDTVPIEGHWFYVYDPDKWSTRIHRLEKLAAGNAPHGWSGIQVEVYFSKYRPFSGNPAVISRAVIEELVEMGFISDKLVKRNKVLTEWRWSEYANIIFTHPRRQALQIIWNWLENHGLAREDEDLDAMSNWDSPPNAIKGTLLMAGRFAQWKYYWTDDCILRGRNLAII